MNHLDYLKDLGVTAIWLTPAIENDEPHASYHGYAVTDYYKIDPRYGTNELYKKFVEKCHSMGIKVVMDLVHNHAGTEGYTDTGYADEKLGASMAKIYQVELSL